MSSSILPPQPPQPPQLWSWGRMVMKIIGIMLVGIGLLIILIYFLSPPVTPETVITPSVVLITGGELITVDGKNFFNAEIKLSYDILSWAVEVNGEKYPFTKTIGEEIVRIMVEIPEREITIIPVGRKEGGKIVRGLLFTISIP